MKIKLSRNSLSGMKFDHKSKKYNIFELMDNNPEGQFFPSYVRFNPTGKSGKDTIEIMGDVQITLKSNEPDEPEFIYYLARGIKTIATLLEE